MSDFLNNSYVTNVLSDFITLAIIAGVGLTIYYFTQRRRLLRFFDVHKSRRIVVYLSNLRIQLGGAIGIDDQARSFKAEAIPAYEASFIRLFQRLFNVVIPGIESQPGPLRWLLVSDINVQISLSPLNDEEVERSSTFIAVGSGGYNMASLRIEGKLNSIGRFDSHSGHILISGLPALEEPNYAFVQRVHDPATDQIAFYVAGPSIMGTRGAVHFLLTQWKYLAKRYPGKKPFCVALRVVTEDGSASEIISEVG